LENKEDSLLVFNLEEDGMFKQDQRFLFFRFLRRFLVAHNFFAVDGREARNDDELVMVLQQGSWFWGMTN
jgi:hypothetical protein